MTLWSSLSDGSLLPWGVHKPIRQVEGSQASARETAVVLRSVISQQRVPHSNQAASLIQAVKSVGVQLIAANPVELAVGNIVRRVLHLIRDEDVALATTDVLGLEVSVDSDDEDDTQHENPSQLSAAALAAANRITLQAPSLHNLLESIPGPEVAASTSSSGGDSEAKSKLSIAAADKNSKSWKLKHGVIEAVNELIEEIDNCYSQIAEQALEHIHQNEVILTLAHSKAVMKFLCEAKKKRSFQVFVAEGAPRYQGHALAKELVAKDLQTTVITDSAVFAMISRVNMVIVGAHAVLANGGVIAPAGLHMVALAAHRHAVPFVVLAGTHKLCPLYPHNPEVLLNDLKSPSELLDYGEFSDCMDGGTGNSRLHVVNPAFDYVPPQLVSLFITDTGGHNPSYMYRLLADYYTPDDYVLQQPLKTK
ncbi:uncharacterized protein LOC131060046 isoform X2 [Cryptomeria japonica]|uniref:uncharacterized protein LOC131060046 isoform X2 n=1 Tax=Cryptomeria japonica TaxID=3369 RepID=UPI0027DA8840|nr:uncharacterized protein LOC131060046 isoform X2 [Cryptomeria japonica]